MTATTFSDKPVLSLEDLTMRFETRRSMGEAMRRTSRARDVLHGVSLDVHPGEIVALVGESGSGKTTTAQIALRMMRPAGGRVLFEGRDITDLTRREMRPLRTRMQMIYQDPYESLNPRHRVAEILVEPLRIHKRLSPTKAEREERLTQALTSVGLPSTHEFRDRYPHELSGGQRQRVAIASSLVLEPRLLIADEPVSMLDVSVRAGILALLVELKREFGLGVLFITHDLSTAACCADRIAVMYEGRIVETGPTGAVIRDPTHPYTRDLIAAVPRRGAPAASPFVKESDPEVQAPASTEGCSYAPRCKFVEERCLKSSPMLRIVSDDAVESSRTVACHRAEEISE